MIIMIKKLRDIMELMIILVIGLLVAFGTWYVCAGVLYLLAFKTLEVM